MEAVRAEWAGSRPCADWIRSERELLAQGEPAARAAILSDHAISLGVGVRPDPEWVRRWEGRGIPVLRRSSGGSGLLHRPGDLAWSLVIPRRPGGLPTRFAESYPEFGRPIVRALASAGLRASWEPPICASDTFCLFGRRGQVLCADRRALGGAAQHLTRGALLHHGVVGTSVDRAAIAEAFDVPDELLRDRLTSLGERSATASVEAIGQAFLAEARRGGALVGASDLADRLAPARDP